MLSSQSCGDAPAAFPIPWQIQLDFAYLTKILKSQMTPVALGLEYIFFRNTFSDSIVGQNDLSNVCFGFWRAGALTGMRATHPANLLVLRLTVDRMQGPPKTWQRIVFECLTAYSFLNLRHLHFSKNVIPFQFLADSRTTMPTGLRKGQSFLAQRGLLGGQPGLI